MYFSTLSENIKSIKADITQPYTLFGNKQQLLKIGAGYQLRKRAVASRTLGFSPYNENGVVFDYSLFNLPENQIFAEANLGLLANGRGGFKLNDGTDANADYTASSALTHVYLMTDQRLLKKIRLVYGVRLEKFNQQLNSVRGFQDTVNLNTEITDLLPSANAVYALTPKMNLRLSYSQTLNRPEFRELAPYVFYDFVSQFSVEGYDKLKRAKISNYDFRYEFFPGKAQLFSISAFYKDFQNPIEFKRDKTNPGQLLYVNVISAKNYGLEAEFRTLLSTIFASKSTGLLSKLTLAANAAYIKSTVRVPDEFFDNPANYRERALQGQSPYVLNSSLTFEDEKLGLSSTVSVNRVGDRIFIVGTETQPNIYEKSRTVTDLQIAKFFLKNKLEIKFNIRDLLAQPLHFYYDADQDKKFSKWDKYFSSTIMPRIFTLTATYKW
jgi:outer membrane receptor protein involved in Fe transport